MRYSFDVDFAFNIEKTVAAAGLLTKRAKGTISMFILLKTMYGAERTALANWHRPITGDTFASLEKGPILSRTYDLIRKRVSASNSDMIIWAKYFLRTGNYVQLLNEPDSDFLSQRESDALKESASCIQELVRRKGRIAEVLHEQWPEWKDPKDFGKAMLPLTIKEVLSEVVRDEDDIDSILNEIRAVGSAKAALQVHSLRA